MANVLEEGSSIIDIIFLVIAYFPTEESYNHEGLQNASVTDFRILGNVDESFYDTMAAVLLL
jgi:hypothetical protein